MRGIIVKLDREGGWGFITSKEKKFTRFFFYWTALKSNLINFTELELGQEVDFESQFVEEKGWRAIKIELVPKEADEVHEIKEADTERIK